MDEVATLIRESKIEEAEQRLQHMQEAGASDSRWHYLNGQLLEAKGLVDEALDAYRASLEIDGDHVEAGFRLAFCLDLRGQDEQAIRIYQALARRTPAHVNGLLNLAVLLEDRGDYRGALMCVRQVLASYPNHTRARLFARDIESSMNMHYDEDQEQSRRKQDAVLDTSINDFELSVRSRNCLRKMNIFNLGDLLRITEPELLTYKNFGETSLTEIKAMLAQKGLRLGQMRAESEDPLVQVIAPSDSAPRFPTMAGTPDILNRPLSEIEFSSRARKCLQRLDLKTVGELITKTEAELLAAKNFGQTSLNEVKQKLGEYGLELRKVT